MNSAANDLLKNGIYVETNGGVVCMSLKDALTSGVGGLKLSVEDLQNIAQLLTQPQPDPSTTDLPLRFEESGPEQSDTLQASSLETDSGKETDTCAAPPPVLIPQKRRGGWPKGRKRKPDTGEVRPPKAPATGYVLYLNERRKLYKDVPFTEVTKLLGGEWSRLSLQEKQKYIDQAEEDKKRYRRELRTYRQSSAYQEFLRNKRLKRLHGGSRTEESDMDATDEIEEDEDNEELYCRRCDQWFSSLHNKKEHLYGRTHLQAVASDHQRQELSTPISTSLDESSLDGCPSGVPSSNRNKQRPQHASCEVNPSDVSSSILGVMESFSGRECEIRCLEKQLLAAQTTNAQLIKKLSLLRERELQLRRQRDLEGQEGSKTNTDLQSIAAICFALTPESILL